MGIKTVSPTWGNLIPLCLPQRLEQCSARSKRLTNTNIINAFVKPPQLFLLTQAQLGFCSRKTLIAAPATLPRVNSLFLLVDFRAGNDLARTQKRTGNLREASYPSFPGWVLKGGRTQRNETRPSESGKYVYQPMTPVEQLPSTEIPARPRETTNTIQISVSLAEHFLKFASVFQPPLPADSPRYCTISDLFIDNYQVKCINGKMCYVQRQPLSHPPKVSPEELSAHGALASKENDTPKIDHCSSPSSSEDSGINAIGAHYVESCDEDTEEGAELSSEEDDSPESSWEPDECTLLSPSQSDLEVIETIETTV
uniref:Chromosome 3 open reading frame 70 n=1 Tax=Ornithorhynchus anatinus TaxID=9258 RepID=F6RTC9_ORNAN